MSDKITWEQAVRSLREEPGNVTVVRDNYFDADLVSSCERFRQSEEFKQSFSLLKKPGSLLDIGAGRGIASYAFAKEGFVVTALEPDPSSDVGAEAIRTIAEQAALSINVVEAFGESLPFEDDTFDVVYARQVLHHAQDLGGFMKEVNRVLKKGGSFLSTRDHVVDDESQKQQFLSNHLLHSKYGGENAFARNEYQTAIKNAGLIIMKELGSYDSPINYFPLTELELKQSIRNKIPLIGSILASNNTLFQMALKWKSARDHAPGRLISFYCIKP